MTQTSAPRGVNQLKELLFDRETKRLDDLSRRIEQEAAATAQRYADVQQQHADLQRQQADVQRQQDELQRQQSDFQRQQSEQDRKHDDTEKRQRELGERVTAVFDRAGSTEKLQHSVADIIDGALREAEVARHDQLSRAIAPLVVRTIKTQLRDSQDEMVEALYPITGQLVKSYVQAAMAEMMVNINAKLGGGGAAAISAQSDAIGVPASELALAQANKLEVEELFLVRKDTGELVAHWERPDAAARNKTSKSGESRDQLFASYLTGIMSVANSTFGTAAGGFRTLSLSENDRLFVRGSATHLVAVRCTGSGSAPVERVIDEVFLQTIEQYQRLLSEDAALVRSGSSSAATPGAAVGTLLPKMGMTIEAMTAERQAQQFAVQAKERETARAAGPSFARVYTMAAVLAAPFVIWGLWSIYQNIMTSRTESAARRALEVTEGLAGMPPRFEVERGGRRVTVTGFVPTTAAKKQVLDRMAAEAPEVAIVDQLGVLPADAGPAHIEILKLRSELDAERVRNTLMRPLERAHARLTQLQADVNGIMPQAGTQDRAALADIARSLSEADQAIMSATATSRNGIAAAQVREPLANSWLKLSQSEARLAQVLGVPGVARSTAGAAPPAQLDLLAEDIAMASERLTAAHLGIGPVLRIGRLRGPTPREDFEALVRGSAVFFENGVDLREPQVAAATIDRLASDMTKLPDVVVRVIGYTDERGSQALNSGLAQQRADRVANALIEKGIAASRLIAVGRTTGKEVSRSVGPSSANRRVEFEIGFPGEVGGQQ